MDPRHLRDIALQAARIATDVHRRHLGELDVSEWAEKGTSDFVTRVDHDAEAAAIAHIRACCPDHDILAEESARLGDAASIRDRFDAAEYLWVIDALDGTTNYLHRYPAYAASLAVAHRGQVVAGAVVDGTTGTAWTAWKGGGAWMDDRRIAVSGVEQLRHAEGEARLPGLQVEKPEYQRTGKAQHDRHPQVHQGPAHEHPDDRRPLRPKGHPDASRPHKPRAIVARKSSSAAVL